VFNWLKKLFSKPEPVASMPIKEEPKLLEKPCRTCGKPIFYDPSWEHIPNYLCYLFRQITVRRSAGSAGEGRGIPGRRGALMTRKSLVKEEKVSNRLLYCKENNIINITNLI
jgi:hypothetical protein